MANNVVQSDGQTINTSSTPLQLPLEMWEVIFDEASRGAELHVKIHDEMPFMIVTEFVNVSGSMLEACSASRKAMLRHLKLCIDLPDVTWVHQVVAPHILDSIHHISRVLTISPSLPYRQAYIPLELDGFKSVKKLEVVIKQQLERVTEPALLAVIGNQEMRADMDYRNCAGLAGIHFTRKSQGASSASKDWAAYFKVPELQNGNTGIEQELEDLSIVAEDQIDINIKYEITYIMQPPPGQEGEMFKYMSTDENGSPCTMSVLALPVDLTVLTWTTKFPTHKISEHSVARV